MSVCLSGYSFVYELHRGHETHCGGRFVAAIFGQKTIILSWPKVSPLQSCRTIFVSIRNLEVYSWNVLVLDLTRITLIALEELTSAVLMIRAQNLHLFTEFIQKLIEGPIILFFEWTNKSCIQSTANGCRRACKLLQDECNFNGNDN